MRIAAVEAMDRSMGAVTQPAPMAPIAPGPTTSSDPAREGLPATAVARRYGTDMLAIPGATGLTWGSADPTLLHVDFVDEASARIAAGLLEPTIDGVRIVARAGDRIVELPDHEAAGSASDRVRAVSAMRGVWDARYSDTSQYQHGMVTFRTVNQPTIDRLDAILRDRISLGWMPETYQPRFLFLTWSAGVPA